MVVLSGRLGWLQGGTRGVELVEDDKEYGVGEDGEVENSGGGHGEQYGQKGTYKFDVNVRVSNEGLWMRLMLGNTTSCCGTQ